MNQVFQRQEDAPAVSLHGSRAALLIIDMINDLNFPENEQLVARSEDLGETVASLKRRCRAAGLPTIYVNDNVGKWRSDFPRVLDQALLPESPGRPMVKRILPDEQDWLVLKPRHSVFYATPLDVILEELKVNSLILVGLSTHSCILLSVSDAYMRGYEIRVPSDCVAGQTEHEHDSTLKLIESNFKVITSPSRELNLHSLAASEATAKR